MRRRDENMESEANLFARCLLMPEHFVRAELKKTDGSRDLTDPNNVVGKLAKKFGVSNEVMTCRLLEIGVIEP